MKRGFRTLFFFLFFPLLSSAQDFFIKRYGVREGLPSDIVKECVQDSLGFFWVATDDGLAKYDGVKFTTYQNVTHGNYLKGFLKTRSGRLLVFGDLDLLEIKNDGDTVVFTQLSGVSKGITDSTLSYPKKLYEDIHGNIWASESQSVVRLGTNALERFDFDLDNRSTQFVRSFTFFEDKAGSLFVVSIQGNVFRFDSVKNKFEKQPVKFPAEVTFVSAFGNDLLIGSSKGVFQSSLLRSGGFSPPVMKVSLPNVSYIERLSDTDFFIATNESNHYVWNDQVTLTNAAINNVNHVYVSQEGDIWLSGNEGLVLLKHNLFRAVNNTLKDFVEAIAEDTLHQTIYYAHKSSLYEFKPDLHQNKRVLHLPEGYFQALLWSGGRLWIANAFNVLLMEEGYVVKRFDFSAQRRFITALSRDSKGNVWIVIPGDSVAHYIDGNLMAHTVDVPLDKTGFINSIRQGEGSVLLTSSGPTSYLFSKEDNASVFRNISLPLNFPFDDDFDVYDVVVLKGQMWLATSAGLVTKNGNRMERVNLGRSMELPVKSIAVYDGKILIANSFGMLLFDPRTGGIDSFNEGSGLLANTITARGLFVDRLRRIWVGTSKGLCYSAMSLDAIHKTPKPRLLQLTADGRKVKLDASATVVSHGSFITATLSSITFPENEVILQYRILPQEHWTQVPGSLLEFPSLETGDHTIEMRAKKNGPYQWSDVTVLTVSMEPPFWQRWTFYVICLGGLIILIALTILIVNLRNEKRHKKMRQLVDQRTRELKIANAELVELNVEKNNLISIVAHDLKSPLKQILGLLSVMKLTTRLDADHLEYIGIIEGSASRLDGMISKILDIEALESARLNVQMEQVDLSEKLSQVLSRFEHTAAAKQIQIEKQIVPGVIVRCDISFVDQVFDNLVSNAIKFSPFNKKIFVKLNIVKGKALVEIKDQGPGLTEDDKKNLFGKFQKLSARPTGDEVSTGLGLSIVRKYVEAMQGELWCESVFGSGASFFVAFGEQKGK